MRLGRQRWASLGLVCILCALAVSARAEKRGAATARELEDEATARQLFEQGQYLVSMSSYEEAYQQFEAGYKVSKRPLFLFNMGECARALGENRRARTDYTRYLDAEPNGKMADAARLRLVQLGGAARSRPGSPDAPLTRAVIVASSTPTALPRPDGTEHAAGAGAEVGATSTGATENEPAPWVTWAVGGGAAVAVVAALTATAVFIYYATAKPTSADPCPAGDFTCFDFRP